MSCPTCGAQTQPDQLYCVSCGTLLPAEAAVWGQLEPAEESLPQRDFEELVSETFHLYRARFWSFLGIAFLAEVPFAIDTLLPTPLVVSILLSLLGVVLLLLVGGAIAYAVAFHYTGNDIRITECYGMALGRVVSLLASTIVFIVTLGFFALLIIIIIGIPLVFYTAVAWSFYVQAIMLEGKKGAWEPLQRSRELVKGSWWRVFGIGVCFIGLSFIIEAGVGIIPGVIASLVSTTAGNVVYSIAGILIMPIAAIGTTLVYFDLRTRKEGYTLSRMASELGIEPG